MRETLVKLIAVSTKLRFQISTEEKVFSWFPSDVLWLLCLNNFLMDGYFYLWLKYPLTAVCCTVSCH